MVFIFQFWYYKCLREVRNNICNYNVASSALFFALCFTLLSCGQCGLVAYSTELEQKDSPHYTYSLDTFQDVWMYMFLWAFSTIFLVHVLASTIALATLRKHKYGRFISVLILLYGTVSAIVVSSVTSAVIAFVLYQAKIEVLLIHAMLCGFCQLGIFLFVTFFTLKPTL
ncbi:UNVERIFIED_CONTAM: hypothetical protein RMT77_012674 [Armadillidium vulgare]|nr:Transmembrane protein [Armadillidium vulgare]